MKGRYSEAQQFVDAALKDVDDFGLRFAKPHLLCTRALTELGLRHFSRADGCLRAAEAIASGTEDLDLDVNTVVIRARILLAQRRIQEALQMTSMEIDRIPTRAMYGEYLATRALALAVTRDHEAARKLAQEARQTTVVVEVQTLAAIAEAIAALDTDESGEMAARCLELAVDLDTWDGLICGMRVDPGLARTFAGTGKAKGLVLRALVRSRDEALLRAAGYGIPRHYGRGELLSPREQDVMDLMKQGLSNKEIGQALFIATGTTKVHVAHILQKLRARTRAQAVARYAAEEASGEADSSSGGST
jgi:ATP/maltotriose-dependent transcriptional regulator MalT